MKCPLSENMCQCLVKEFDSRNNGRIGLGFDDYIRCCATVQSFHKSFTMKQDNTGHVTLDLESFMLMVLESRPRPVENLAFD